MLCAQIDEASAVRYPESSGDVFVLWLLMFCRPPKS